MNLHKKIAKCKVFTVMLAKVKLWVEKGRLVHSELMCMVYQVFETGS